MKKECTVVGLEPNNPVPCVCPKVALFVVPPKRVPVVGFEPKRDEVAGAVEPKSDELDEVALGNPVDAKIFHYRDQSL